MALLCYFASSSSLPLSGSVPSFTPETVCKVNKRGASHCEMGGLVPKWLKTNCSSYSTDECGHIGKYAAEHSPTKASRPFSSLLKRPVPESTACLLKKQYLVEFQNRCKHGEVPEVTSLPMKVGGHPLLIGSKLDGQVRDYITALWGTAGVVDTAIALAAAEGVHAIGIRLQSILFLSVDGQRREIMKGNPHCRPWWQTRNHCGSNSNACWGVSPQILYQGDGAATVVAAASPVLR